MLEAAERGDWETAAREVLESRYHRQVGLRAERLAEQLRTGVWQ
jgi:lysozyme